MEYSYKFRLYPTSKQKELITKTFGCCRFVYNYYLAKKMDLYNTKKETLNYCDCSKDMTVLKKSLSWLREVDASALQSSIKNLDIAYQNFFRRVKHGEKPGYPKFKSKHNTRQSYTSRSPGFIKVFDNAIQIPKLGKVKCRISKQVYGRILSATISYSHSGKYFVSLCCTDVEIVHLPSTGLAVGIDMGIKTLAITSDGMTYSNHKYLEKSKEHLAKLQRQLSRKTKGSHRQEKARLKVARLYEKIANQRNDMLHKLTTELMRNYDIICIEDLEPQNMVKNNKLARAIYDASWGELHRQLTYKSLWYGRKVIAIDRFYPSSQICSNCGYQWTGTKNLAVRKWTCPHCGATHDRDVNAAINILNEGLRILSA